MRARRADAHAALARDVADVARSVRSCSSTSAGVWHTGVATSSTDCISSALMRGSSSCPRHGGEHGVDVLDEVERLGVEQHVLLLDAERVRVALAERVVEDAAALGEAGCPCPVIDAG